MQKRVFGVLAAMVLWVGIVSLSSTRAAAQEVDGQDVQQEGQFGPGSTVDTPGGVEAAEPAENGLEPAETNSASDRKLKDEAGKDVQEGPQIESMGAMRWIAPSTTTWICRS